MFQIAVIGFGYWGPNLVRNFMACPGAHVKYVCDRDPIRLNRAKALYPLISATSLLDDVLNDPSVDAVCIATPVHTHYEIAMSALVAGKHVFVEKPITNNSDLAVKLIDVAEHRKLILMVDHTFVYTGAVRKIHEIVNESNFGKIQYYDSTRVNLGLFQQDVNVLWDLAVHDLSIMSFILDDKPLGVSATGLSLAPGRPEYAAFLTVFFENSIAHINVNWLSPVKIRRTLVGGSGKMIVFDDLETSEKVKIYDKGVSISEDPDEVHKLLVSYRLGDMIAPKLEENEALASAVSHFIACIEKNEKPLSSGNAGLEIVRILEAADKSMLLKGSPIEL